MICYLDTNVVIFLGEKKLKKIPRPALRAIDRSDLLVSPMVLLELHYLNSVNRLPMPAQHLLQELKAEIGLEICPFPFPAIVEAALLETWTKEPFDRLIVSHARANRFSPLVSSDEKIAANYPKTVWS